MASCSESRTDGMKVSESKEEKPKTKKRKFLQESHEKEAKKEKRKTKKRKLSKRRCSKVESKKRERKKRDSRFMNSYRNESIGKMSAAELLEEGLKEAHLIYGGTEVAYDRDDPSRSGIGEDLKNLVNLAIDFYNKNNSTDYRLVYLVRATFRLCQGAVYYMTMTAKLPDQDDADAITFEANVYEGIPSTKIVIDFVRPYVST